MIAESAKLAYSVTEAAEATGLSRSRIFELLASGELTAKKQGAKTLILREVLVAYLHALPDARPLAA